MSGRPGRHVHHRDAGALRPAAQRRQRAGARLHAAVAGRGRGDPGRLHRHADARGPLHPPSRQDSRARDAPAHADGRPRSRAPDPDHRRGGGGGAGHRRAGPMRLSRGAVRVLSRPAARGDRGRRLAAGPARLGRGRRRRGGDDRPHAAQAGRDARRNRGAVPRGGRVPVRQRVREPDVGGHLRPAAPGRRRRRCARWSAFRSARRRPT